MYMPPLILLVWRALSAVVSLHMCVVVGNYLGFGLMDALKMVTLAKQWKRVPDQKRCEISSSVSKKRFVPPTSSIL